VLQLLLEQVEQPDEPDEPLAGAKLLPFLKLHAESCRLTLFP